MPDVDLYLLGAGIKFPSHLSLETLLTFEKCRCVLTNLPPEALEGLPADVRDRVESLWHLYRPGAVRIVNYASVVSAVVAAAEGGRPVGWLTVGHPMIFDSVTADLLDECSRRGWNASVVPAVSSIDTLLATIRFEPAHGLHIYEATSLVARQIEPNPNVATLLLQPSAFQNNKAMLRRQDLVINLAPLRDYLSHFYPSSHACVFVRCAQSDASADSVRWVELQDFADVDPLAIAGSTLFIPAVQP